MKLLYHIQSADLLTPLSAFIRLSALSEAENNPYRLFFESVEGGESRGRYSIIALLPDIVWECRNRDVFLNGVRKEAPPMEVLKDLVDNSQMTLAEGLPPMIGGVFGVLGYDMVRHMEDLPHMPEDDLGLPEGIMIRPRLFAIFDAVRDELVLAVTMRDGTTGHDGKAQEYAESLFARAKAALHGELHYEDEKLSRPHNLSEPVSNMSHEQFLRAVERAKEYIAAGDVFQLVPSQRFQTDFPLSPLALYRSLRRVNPAPFLFLMALGPYTLVGSSPEILVRLRKGEVTVRPLAGTRPRGKDMEHDRELERELLADRKELAEHLMLIDLGRNDVGRVSILGSVQVPEQFVIERYSHVMHISSAVTGKIRPDMGAMEALKATFPAGTLTGAPKIRAMEIIDELEPTRRGPYAGCVGYFGADGEMDTCIGLRMAVLKDGKMYVQAGCGVVADSSPEAEYQETRAKARALFSAAERAIAQATSHLD